MTQKSLPQHYAIQCFSRIPGVDGGMIVAAFDSSHNDYTTVLFTPDFFNTFKIIQTGLSSDGGGNFINSKSGWLSGDGNRNSSIYKLTTNLISGVAGAAAENTQLQVYPTPSSAEAILKIPSPKSQTTMTMRITDITGKEMENRRITMLSPYIQLNAAKYTNGIYIIWLNFGWWRISSLPLGGAPTDCRKIQVHQNRIFSQ